jgi:AAA family ATP:ADP antiporter
MNSSLQPAVSPSLQRHRLEAWLRVFAEVRPGEGAVALVMTLNVFLLLTAYYLLKVAREPLILTGGGAEVKSYAAAGQAVLLIVVTTAYGALARRCDRMRLITWVTLFFASNLVLFAALTRTTLPLGVAFYLWVGIFNVTIIAQFWAFAADIYTEERGKRLFPILGVGSSVGAVFGAAIATALIRLGPAGLMLAAAATLLVCLGLVAWVNRRTGEREERSPGNGHGAGEQVLAGDGGFRLLARDRYLLWVGALAFVLNWVNSTGEYVLDRTLLAAAPEDALRGGESVAQFIGSFKAEFFAWVNIVGMGLQMFAVSRIIRYLGVRRALFIMPFVSLTGYSLVALTPVLSIIFAAKIAENSLDYSLSNTARQALWLVTSREAKYKAKQVTDTFVVRAGDVMAAASVWVGVRLGFDTRTFLGFNMVLILLWMGVLVLLSREHARQAVARSGG